LWFKWGEQAAYHKVIFCGANEKDPPRCHGESISLTVIGIPACTVIAG
jgi:hypothetical protein